MQENWARRVILLSWLISAILLSNFAGNISFQLIEVWIVNSIPILFLALAAGIIISCGQIDISTGGIMSVVGMGIIFIFNMLGHSYLSIFSSHIMMLICIGILYSFYSFAVNRGISSLIITLSFLLISKGMSTLIQSCMQGAGQVCRDLNTNTLGSGVIPKNYLFNSADSLLFSIIVLFFILFLLTYWRYRTRWGLEHIGVGMDTKSAKFSHISIVKIYKYAFLTAGLLIYVGTLIRLHGQSNGGWTANTGWGEELLAIAIAVIGGTRITGGRFDPISIAITTFAMYVSRDIITNDFGIPSEVTSMLFGVILIAIIWMDVNAQKYRKRFL